jgi:hypothetical protein
VNIFDFRQCSKARRSHDLYIWRWNARLGVLALIVTVIALVAAVVAVAARYGSG